MSKKIRILIADDHAVVRRGLRTILLSEPEMELVDEAADGIEAVLKARTCHRDVILLDTASSASCTWPIARRPPFTLYARTLQR